jgi:acetyl-CoA C-acetyltransferase
LQSWPASVQAESDGRRGPVPPFLVETTGPASLETFTVIFDRDGAVNHGVVILRSKDGARTLARVPAADSDTVRLLTDLDIAPLGIDGVLTSNADGISDWRARS